MVSILPGESNWERIGQAIGQNLGQSLPGATQQGFQRQMGLNAIDQLQTALQDAGGDINKMLPALAKAYTLNPGLERSGLGQTYLQRALVGNALGQNGQNAGNTQLSTPEIPQVQSSDEIPLPYKGAPSAKQGSFATPSAFNLMTPQDIDTESTRYAQALGDPNAKQVRQTQLQNQNNIANEQRKALEEVAESSGIKASEMPRFMKVGSEFDPRNPSEWVEQTRRKYNLVKSNDEKLQREFIPGIGSGLLARNRQGFLKRLEPTVQDQIALGQESEVRDFLADEYLSPTEIESLIHPIQPKQEKALKTLPKGTFPAEKKKTWNDIYKGNIGKTGLASYEEALEKAPEELKLMQNQLSDFFLKNVDDDTSLLVLRDKLWENKDYDWRQIGPAIREAQKKGLVLNRAQSTEMADIETQPPIQSLPDIFQDWWRIPQFLRGNK